MKTILLIATIGLSQFLSAQVLINGDLEGPPNAGITAPEGREFVPYTDPVCEAYDAVNATPDILDLYGPSPDSGIMGNPYFGSTFVSGLNTSYFHEGIQQEVSGFVAGNKYKLSFYQTVVKQYLVSAYDTSGGWSVFIDSDLIFISEASVSYLPFNSTEMVWDYREIEFEAPDSVLTIKLLAQDDDDNDAWNGFPNGDGALRMGIDYIMLDTVASVDTTVTSLGSDLSNSRLKMFPNPAGQFIQMVSESSPISNVSFFDLSGRSMLSTPINEEKQITIPLEFASGTYVARVEFSDGKLDSQLVIVK